MSIPDLWQKKSARTRGTQEELGFQRSRINSQPAGRPVLEQTPLQWWAPEACPGSHEVVKTRSCWKKRRERQQGLKRMPVTWGNAAEREAGSEFSAGMEERDDHTVLSCTAEDVICFMKFSGLPVGHTRVKFKCLGGPSEVFHAQTRHSHTWEARYFCPGAPPPRTPSSSSRSLSPHSTGQFASRKTSGIPRDEWGKNTGSEVRPSGSKLSSTSQPCL